MQNLVKARTIPACLLSFFIISFIGATSYAEEKQTAMEDLLVMEIPTVVTASKVSEKLSDAPGVISVLTKDELERFGGTTLKDILEQIPGLIGSTNYLTDRSLMSINGSQFKVNDAQILLLINGRPVREGLDGGIVSEMLQSFPVNIIERIEVIKGPGSVLYGSGAFAGVINVITEKPKKDSITLTGLGGDSGAYETMGKVSYVSNDVSILAAGQYNKKADWSTGFDDTNTGTSAGAVVKNNITIPDNGPGSYLEVNYKNLKLMTSYDKWNSVSYAINFPANVGLGGANWEKQFADLGYTTKVNDKWNMDFNATYTRSKFLLTDGQAPDVKRDSYFLTGEWTNFINPSEKLSILVGGTYNYVNGTELVQGGPYEGYDDISDQWSYGLYAQADYWLIQNKLKVIGGACGTKVQNIDMNVVPRASVIFYPVENVNIKAQYSEAFRAPSLNETNLTFPTIKGNPNLSSEKDNTTDIGVNYYKGNVQAGLDFFYTKMSNIIFGIPNTPAAPGIYSNTDAVELQGAEIEGKYYINKEFFVSASFLYQKSKDDVTGAEDVTPIPNSSAKAGISYKSDKGVILSLFNSYQGTLDSMYNTQLNPSPTDAYSLMSLHGRLDMNKFFGWDTKERLAIILQVDNLLDKELWLPNLGMAVGNSIPVNQGRTAYLGIELSI